MFHALFLRASAGNLSQWATPRFTTISTQWNITPVSRCRFGDLEKGELAELISIPGVQKEEESLFASFVAYLVDVFASVTRDLGYIWMESEFGMKGIYESKLIEICSKSWPNMKVFNRSENYWCLFREEYITTLSNIQRNIPDQNMGPMCPSGSWRFVDPSRVYFGAGVSTKFALSPGRVWSLSCGQVIAGVCFGELVLPRWNIARLRTKILALRLASCKFVDPSRVYVRQDRR